MENYSEFIYGKMNDEEIQDDIIILETENDLPKLGISGKYYHIKETGKSYIWNDMYYKYLSITLNRFNNNISKIIVAKL